MIRAGQAGMNNVGVASAKSQGSSAKVIVLKGEKQADPRIKRSRTKEIQVRIIRVFRGPSFLRG
jgi:hypothetical protein